MAWDLIVCGAGTAGIPAAMFAAARGARVLAIEHAAEVGGTLHYAAGQISAAGTRLQAEKGIEDSADLHYDDIVRISEGQTSRPFARLIADHAADTLHWLLDLGWRPLPDHPVLFGQTPYSVPRTYWGAKAGVSILEAVRPAFLDVVARGDVTLMTETEVVDLVIDEHGDVAGVRTRSADGREQTHRGRNVLLTTGGFGAGGDLFREITGYPLFTWAWPYCRGAGARLALDAGGEMRHRQHFVPRLAGVQNPERPERAERITDLSGRRPPWEIYVTAAGTRFVAEDIETPLAREKALLQVPDLTFWVVYDETIRRDAPPLFDRMSDAELDRWLGRHPSYCRAGTLEELADQAGIDRAALVRTVAAYNASCESGDDPLGRKHMPRPIAAPPFYAIRHHGVAPNTIPGIGVNGRFQVVRKDGSPVGNLYAAGEILGMGLLSGNAFVGGMGLMPALTFGKMLGESILPLETESQAAD